MARVFLSYAHEDAAKAKATAMALERGGHAVWWDRDIRGGTAFSDEIEAALKAAHAVVVLWSKASIQSAWVRDEAAEGRDTGRLIPVLLDGCKPPLGFRQVQSLDFSRWRGRMNAPAVEELLGAVSSLVDPQEPLAVPDAGAVPKPPNRSRPLRRPWLVAGALSVFAVILAAFLLVPHRFNPLSASESPSLAVMPFVDLSPARDHGYFAEGVAEEILTTLARDPRIRVLGRTSSWQVRASAHDLPALRRALDVSHILEGSARAHQGRLRMSVRLVRTSDGSQIWAEDYEGTLDNVFEFQERIAGTVARNLRGVLGGAPAQFARNETTVDAYSLFLAARARARERQERPLSEALDIARRVVAADPNYAPGHALVAELIWLLSDNGNSYGRIPMARARALALPHARTAIRLAPNLGDGYASLALLSPPQEAVEPLRRAIALDPARAELRVWLGITYNQLGRNEEALTEYRAAVDIEPMWPVPVARLVNILAASGLPDEAREVIAGYQSRGGRPDQVARMSEIIPRFSGDLSEAVRQGRAALRLAPGIPYIRTYLLSHYSVLGLPRLAERVPAERNQRLRHLYATGRRAELLAAIASDGASVLNRPDAQVAVLLLAETRQWRRLAGLYDGNRSRREEICADTMAVPLALALRSTGREQEGSSLLACWQRWLDRQAQGPIRSSYLSRGELAFQQAQRLSIEGNQAAALQKLSDAVHFGWRGSSFSANLASYPALDQLRRAPEFLRTQARLNQFIETERQEVLRTAG